jgi:hypothetical protein
MTPDPVIVMRLHITPGGRGWFQNSTVVASTHPDFAVGTQVDFKKVKQAIVDGAELTILPPDKK